MEEYRCSVLGCLKTPGNKVKLHEFPFDNHSLLPVWIMATNRRSDWMPTAQSRICDRHFSVDEHEGGDMANKLKPNACPMLNVPASNAIKDDDDDDDDDDDVMMAVSDVSSTSDVHLSDIGSDDTPNTIDMNFSDDESNLILSGSDSNWNEATGLDDDFLSSLSDENESDEDALDSSFEFYNVSSSPLMPCLYSAEHLPDQSCAVTLCNEIVRSQFNDLFFVNFPLNNPVLCDTWWKTCGRSGEFDPSLKICSIHFYSSDFRVIAKKYNNQLYRQFILKNKNTVPSLYLLSHEYTKFSKKQKKCADNSNKSEIKKCAVLNCDKTFLKDQTTTLFFKFPLENKCLVTKWLDNIKLSNWQPSENDVLCSDHFESYHVIKINNSYKLDDNAVPSIKPEKSFILNPENFHKKSDKDSKIFNKHQLENINDYVVSACVQNENVKRKRTEVDETIVLTNDAHDGKQQYNETATTSYSTNKNINEEKKVVNENSFNNKFELEYVYLDVLNDENMVEVQPITTKNGSLKKNYLIPKSRNNGSDHDYVYLDTLTGDDVGEFLSFEKKCISNNFKQEIPDLLGKKHTNEIPESIIYNEELLESYGEMLLPNCEEGCRDLCYYSIPNPQRRYIFKEFQMLDSATEQNCKIAQLIRLRMIKKENTFESCPSYYLIMNNRSVKVCRLFFRNTLGIPECRLNAILNPINYSWYSDRETALEANVPNRVKIVGEPIVLTDFAKTSLILLNKDYNLFEPENDTNGEVGLESVPLEEYRKIFLFLKSIPRVLSSHQINKESKKQLFESSICLDFMYNTYTDQYIKNKTTPPYTKHQFKTIYNQYMKTFLKMI